MSELVRYSLESRSETVRFEVDPEEGWVQAGAGDRLAGTISTAIQPAVAAARTVLAAFEDAKPSEAEVMFSVKVTGDANWVVAKASTEGSFQVRLLWKKERPNE